MSREQVKNVAASVKNRLLSLARHSGKPFQSLLTQYGLERFLCRLSQSPMKEKFILKGGLLLVGMGLPLARTTRDIDFLGLMPSDIGSLGSCIREIGSMELNDGLVYEFADLSMESISGNAEYPGTRLKFDAWIGKAKIPMQIDVGFGDVMVPAAQEMTFPTLLDMEPPIVMAYSVETIVAEKLEAALNLADVNSRMKDFYDIWMLCHAYQFHGATLQEAVIATCQRRATPLNSQAPIFSKEFAGKADKRTQWTSFLRKAQIPDITDNFSIIMESIWMFLYPIIEASEKQTRFDREWPVGGPWQ